MKRMTVSSKVLLDVDNALDFFLFLAQRPFLMHGFFTKYYQEYILTTLNDFFASLYSGRSRIRFRGRDQYSGSKIIREIKVLRCPAND